MLKVVKKAELPQKQTVLLRICAVFIALLGAGLIMAMLGYNPITIFKEIIVGSTGTSHRITETINKAIPLVVLSLGIAVAFKMKFWNIGAEGQFYMGAFGATAVVMAMPNLPIYFMLPAMFFAAVITGGLWALLPAVLKFKFGTSETLVTLMMNYIAISWIGYLKNGPWKDPSAKGFAQFATFNDNAVLPTLFGVHCGWVIALVLVGVVYLLMKKSKLGYEMAVLGENENTARYAGMNIGKVLIISAIISGGLCGVAGMMEASAIEGALSDNLSGGLGFTAIITAWLAQLSAPVIVITSLMFAALIQGGVYLQTAMQVPATVAEVIQGIILFVVLGSEFFIRYKVVRVSKSHKTVQETKKEV